METICLSQLTLAIPDFLAPKTGTQSPISYWSDGWNCWSEKRQNGILSKTIVVPKPILMKYFSLPSPSGESTGSVGRFGRKGKNKNKTIVKIFRKWKPR